MIKIGLKRGFRKVFKWKENGFLMGLAGKTAIVIRFLSGHRPFEGEVLEREYRDVGSFKFPVTLYSIRVKGNGGLLHLSEEGHTKHFEPGDIIRGYRSIDPGACDSRTNWYRIVRAEKVDKV